MSAPLPAQARSSAADDTGNRQFSFHDMRLLVGDRLQVQCPVHLGSPRVFVKVVGYLENSSLIVTAPFRRGARLALLEGEILVVRAFSRQSAFAFRCSILRVCRMPFDYLHLSFPDRIQGSVIRKSTRVRTRIPVQINGQHLPDTSITNISASGALVSTEQALASVGERLQLRFTVDLHDVESTLDLQAEVLNVMQDEDPLTGKPVGPMQHGVEFRDINPNDRLILKSLVYQQMIEKPDTVV